MGTTLHTLTPQPGATKRAKRVGRGIGSRRGKTATRGVKGQKARTGHHGAIIGFEGGQMPLQRRLPKRGFQNPFRREFHPINLSDLQRLSDDVTEVTAELLVKAGMLPRKAKWFKVLGGGELTRKLNVKAHAYSETAKAKIAAAGGQAEVVESDTGAASKAGREV